MKKLTCIMCPVGCSLEVSKKGKEYIVTGNGCIRGQRYGISEVTNPTRMITTLVKTASGVASVKTTNLVPKNKIKDVLNEISKLSPQKVRFGEVLIKNVCNLENVDVVVTRA